MIDILHRTAGAAALLLIATFWTSTVVSESFGSHATIATVKLTVAWMLPVLAAALMATGISGRRLAGDRRSAVLDAKRRRMTFAAANGMLFLIPCAVFLAVRSAEGLFDGTFFTVQVIELVAGATNLVLLGLNMRAGLAMRRHPPA